MNDHPLARAFFRGRGSETLGAPVEHALDGALASLLEAGLATWPQARVEPDAFALQLGRALAESVAPLADLGKLAATDVYLAAACASGDPWAIGELERSCITQIPLFLRKLDPDPTFADEVQQIVRARLLTSDDEGLPRIARYSGTGPLGAWVRVTAVRIARNLKRAERRAGADPDDGARIVSQGSDPELEYLKRRYGHEVTEAFRATLGALSPREKNVLTLYFLEGVSSQAIGKLYKVHGATVRRWIEQVREHVYAEARRLLEQRLGGRAAELESLMGFVESRLNLSICEALQTASGERR